MKIDRLSPKKKEEGRLFHSFVICFCLVLFMQSSTYQDVMEVGHQDFNFHPKLSTKDRRHTSIQRVGTCKRKQDHNLT